MAARDPDAEILVVAPHPDALRTIASFLEDRGFRVERAHEGEQAFNQLDARPFDGLVFALNVRGAEGLRLLRVGLERNPELCAVALAEPPEVELATEAVRAGAYDYQTPPVNLAKLEAVLQRGVRDQQRALTRHHLQRRLDERYGLGNLVGQSRQMMHLYTLVRQAAATNAPVLIAGEPGAGKDLIAQAIHTNSSRRDEPFVRFDCATMPARLQAIELFGHGGAQGRRGRLESADRGTLFLDEVWALPEPLQERMLSVLETGRYARPGDGRMLRTDVRLMAATTRPLEARVEAGAFNAKLCAALSGLVIEAPALRDRREDVAPLLAHMARETATRLGVAYEGFTPGGMGVLTRYDWPGNVRELKNTVEAMLVASGGARPLDVSDVPDQIRRDTASEAKEIRAPVGATMEDVERAAIEETLKACGFDKKACAATLKIGLRTLYRKIAQYQIG